MRAHSPANGYRYYGQKALLRLQQILLHRELGLPLDAIGALLDSGDAIGSSACANIGCSCCSEQITTAIRH